MHCNSPEQPPTIYLSYAQKDEALKLEFEDYLAVLQQVRLISGWAERQVQTGMDWSQVIDPRILEADIVLVLVSPALFGSGYCSGAEIHETFRRINTGQVRIIPIILRYVDLSGHLFESIRPLPGKLGPVLSWPHRDDAWKHIDQAIRTVLQQYPPSHTQTRNSLH